MQVDTIEQVFKNFVIDFGPEAETHRWLRHSELDAAWRVALALRNDTIAQHASVAAELQGHKAKIAAAKVLHRQICVICCLVPLHSRSLLKGAVYRLGTCSLKVNSHMFAACGMKAACNLSGKV